MFNSTQSEQGTTVIILGMHSREGGGKCENKRGQITLGHGEYQIVKGGKLCTRKRCLVTKNVSYQAATSTNQ